MDKKINIGDVIYAIGERNIYEEKVAFIGNDTFITELTYGERIEYSYYEYSKTWALNFEEAKEIVEKNNPSGKLVFEGDGFWSIYFSKVKLKDFTLDDFAIWKARNCSNYRGCEGCPFESVICETDISECWVRHKDLYSDKFLEQEIDLGREE